MISIYNSGLFVNSYPMLFVLPFTSIKGTPGEVLVTFLRLFPLFVGLYCRLYLLRAKDLLDPLIFGGDLSQGFVL